MFNPRARNTSESESVSSNGSTIPLTGIYSQPRKSSAGKPIPAPEPQRVEAVVGERLHSIDEPKEEYMEMNVPAERIAPAPLSPEVRRKFPVGPALELADSPVESLYARQVPESPIRPERPTLPEIPPQPIYDTADGARVEVFQPYATSVQKYRLSERLSEAERVVKVNNSRICYSAMVAPVTACTSVLATGIPSYSLAMGTTTSALPLAVIATSLVIGGIAGGATGMLIKDIGCFYYERKKAQKEEKDILEVIGRPL